MQRKSWVVSRTLHEKRNKRTGNKQTNEAKNEQSWKRYQKSACMAVSV